MPFDHFDVIAPIYARVAYSSADKMRELAELPINGRLLDIGGGTGRVSSILLTDVGEVVVADVSMGMLDKTDRSALKPVCSYSEFLPFPAASFERVIMVDALHHVIDQIATAREMLRVLKPGGILIIVEPDINTFSVKLIALAEKMLLMRSHFLSPRQISGLFSADPVKVDVHSEDSSAWVVVTK